MFERGILIDRDIVRERVVYILFARKILVARDIVT